MQKLHPLILAGEDLELTCKVSDTTAEVKWKKNGSPVTPKARISRKDGNSTLVIENVVSDDSGNYSCEAHNRAGFMMSSTVGIEVMGRVAFIVVFKSVSRFDENN